MPSKTNTYNGTWKTVFPCLCQKIISFRRICPADFREIKMSIFGVLDIRLMCVALTQPGLDFTAEQVQLKPPPVPIFTHRRAVNHAGCLAEVVDHRTMVN